jgi:beta-mannanase
VDPLYPGDDVVDWIAYDPYGTSATDTFEKLLNQPNGEEWPGFYRWATTKAPGTPIMLAEWGFDPALHPDATDALGDATQTLRGEFPMIKALVYWNSQGQRVDARLREGGEQADRFAEAYAEFTRDSYFNSTPTELAP